MGKPIFIFCILRGAMDGLDIVIPRGDPEFNRVRQNFPFAGERDLDGFFSLHGRLDVLHDMAMKKEAVFVHATGTGYVDRSHFDGQKVLETGGVDALQLKNGWMNRLVTIMDEVSPVLRAAVGSAGLAVAGEAFFPAYEERIPVPSDTLLDELRLLWSGDEKLAGTIAQLETHKQMTASLTSAGRLSELAKLGHQVFFTSFGGFDTHTAQSWILAGAIDHVDNWLGELRSVMAEQWDDVVFVGVSEFGRNFRPNTAAGTDHGIANVMILAGGALKKWDLPVVISQWPGLTTEKLFQGRDLAATKSVWNVLYSVLVRHMGLNFPASLLFPTRPEITTDEDIMAGFDIPDHEEFAAVVVPKKSIPMDWVSGGVISTLDPNILFYNRPSL